MSITQQLKKLNSVRTLETHDKISVSSSGDIQASSSSSFLQAKDQFPLIQKPQIHSRISKSTLPLKQPVGTTPAQVNIPETNSLCENLDLMNLQNIKLIRTSEDDEFSQILKKNGPQKSTMPYQFEGIEPRNISQKLLPRSTLPQPYQSSTNKYISDSKQSRTSLPNSDSILQNFSKKIKIEKDTPSSCATPGEHWRQEFLLLSSSGANGKNGDFIGSSGFSFKDRKKKGSIALKRNLFNVEKNIDSNEGSNLTLEQYSKFSFARNPFVRGCRKFEESELISKTILLSQSEQFTFLCPTCFKFASQLSQKDTNENEISTAKKKVSKSIYDADGNASEEDTADKEQNNLFGQISKNNSTLPCFCREGVLGWQQFHNRLLDTHMSKVANQDQVKSYYKYLVWRLSSRNILSVESLYYSIEYRLYLTHFKDFTPFLAKYIKNLKNEENNKKQVTISAKKPSQILLLIGNIKETEKEFILELTDTWSSVFKHVSKQLILPSSVSVESISQPLKKLKMTNDQLFEELLIHNQIKQGQKVRVANLSLFQEYKSTSQESKSVSSIPTITSKTSTPEKVDIYLNGFQKDIFSNTKLGFLNKPFLRTITSIRPQGGLVPCLDVILLKKYPLLVQYFTGNAQNKKKILTFASAVHPGVIPVNPDKTDQEQYFLAKFLVCDSLMIYDKQVSISSQPRTEITIKFQNPQGFNELQQGERILIFNASVDKVEISKYFPAGYKLSLTAGFNEQIILQSKFLRKADLSKTNIFYKGMAKNFALTRTLSDLPASLTLNYIEILEFDFQFKLKQLSNDFCEAYGEVVYSSMTFNCEVQLHIPFFLKKLQHLELPYSVHFQSVHFKSINEEKRILKFKTSFHSTISL